MRCKMQEPPTFEPRTRCYRLDYPPSINSYYAQVGNRRYVSKAGKDYRRRVVEEAYRYGDEPLTGRLAVLIELTMPDRRKRDLDNTLKVLLDSLEDAAVFLDDSQIDDLQIKRLHVESPGCADVTIVEIAP